MEQKITDLLNQLYPVNIYKTESVTNEMYRCRAKQGNYFARITAYKTYEEQLEEVKWTNYLHEQGFGAPLALSSVNGKIVEIMGLDKDKLIVLYKTACGVHLPREKWHPHVVKELGRQIGRLHHYAKEYAAVAPIKHIGHWHDNEEYNFLKYIPPKETAIRTVADDVLTQITALPISNSTYGVIHGDIWLENILVNEDLKLTLVDFQDFEKHFFIYDLVIPIYSALEFSFVGRGNIIDYKHAITQAILEGYMENNDIPDEMQNHLPLFFKLKELFEYNMMHMYWDQATLSEEQVRIINLYRLRIECNV